MKIRNSMYLGLLGVTLIMGGCQDTGKTERNVGEKKDSLTQSKKELNNDLSALSGDAKAITEGVNKNNSKKIVDNKNNKEKKMNDKAETKEDLPMNMELAKTCKKAIVETSMGKIEIEFFGERTPMTVANFCTLAEKDFYNKITFHRVIKNFMIQGGDPQGDGFGGPGYAFEDEIAEGNSNDKYTIAMANSGPNTNGSQFFINTKANHFLDGKHTVFGKIVKGMEIVDEIENAEVGAGDRPVEDIVIKKIELVKTDK